MSELSPIRNVKVEVDAFYNYSFKFPNGMTIPATMNDILLWELLQELREFNSRAT